MFADQNFSWYQCGFRKGFSAQYSLVAMMARWKGGADDGKVFASLLNDLSKAFDCLSHKLIIGNNYCQGFGLPALKLVYDYLFYRQERTKINQDVSSRAEVLFRVLEGSLLGPKFINIF